MCICTVATVYWLTTVTFKRWVSTLRLIISSEIWSKFFPVCACSARGLWKQNAVPLHLPHSSRHYNQIPFCSNTQLVKTHPDVEEEVRKQLTHEHRVPCWFTQKKDNMLLRVNTAIVIENSTSNPYCEWCPDHAEDVYSFYVLLLHPPCSVHFKPA